MLDLIGEVQGMLELDELIDGMLAAIQRNVPSIYVSLNDIGPDTDRVISVVRPELPESLYRLYGEYAFQNPIMLRYLETLDGRPYRFSDVTTQEELHKLELYQHVYAPVDVEHQMAFTLPATPGRVIAIALCRSDCDYTDEEREVIERARPFLIQAWRNAIDHTALRDELAARPLGPTGSDGAAVDGLRARGLTERQAQVMALVARGRSNRDAGAILGISERTVQKHLEHCYRVLDLPGRSAAAEMVWGLPDPNGDPPVEEPARRGLDGRPGAVG
ncbi:MAG TPA: helix-turn-helix transcriptional regulator [Solirubrobacterales bacterium]|nr:helix-turn-helix transcriptional regulator [Solirubrobacterales bacterium]